MRSFAAAFLAGLIAASAQAQGYPNVDRQVEIAPGESVVLLNRILVDRAPGVRSVRRMEFQVRTTIPASNGSARASQAERAAQAFGEQARDAGARTLSVSFCDTEACARRDQPPAQWFLFELRSGNVWKRVDR